MHYNFMDSFHTYVVCVIASSLRTFTCQSRRHSLLLTHVCLMDPSIHISWTSPFPILGVSGVLFSFLSYLWRITLIQLSGASHPPTEKSPSFWIFKALSSVNWLNPYLPDGLSHPYQLDDSMFHLKGVWCTFSFLSYFWQKFQWANSVDPDQTTRSESACPFAIT